MTTSHHSLSEILEIEKNELNTLTAEEIDMLIEYRAKVKADQETAKKMLEQNEAALNKEIKRAEEAAAKAEEAFVRACEAVPELKRV